LDASVNPALETNAAAAEPTPSFSTNSLRFIGTSAFGSTGPAEKETADDSTARALERFGVAWLFRQRFMPPSRL